VDNVLWINDRGSFRSVEHADGSRMGTVFAITEDTDHTLWVREGSHLDRVQDGKLVGQVTSPQIASAYTLAANPQGGLILGLVSGDLIYYRDGVTQTIPSNETGNTRQVRDLLVDPDGSVWGTTLDELARWKDGQRRNLTPRNGLPCDGIFALVQDASRAIWLYTRCGLIRIPREELDRWWQAPDTVIKVSLIDQIAGIQPGLTGLKPQATRTPNGQLWFVNGRILQMFDPRASRENTRPPPVQVEQVVADRRTSPTGARTQRRRICVFPRSPATLRLTTRR
jgi:ligand-binding sensor domain-containing protein